MDFVKTGNFAPLADRVGNSFARPGSFPTLEEAEQNRQQLVKLIFDNYNELKEIVQQNEQLLTYAWKAKRAGLLRSILSPSKRNSTTP